MTNRSKQFLIAALFALVPLSAVADDSPAAHKGELTRQCSHGRIQSAERLAFVAHRRCVDLEAQLARLGTAGGSLPVPGSMPVYSDALAKHVRRVTAKAQLVCELAESRATALSALKAKCAAATPTVSPTPHSHPEHHGKPE